VVIWLGPMATPDANVPFKLTAVVMAKEQSVPTQPGVHLPQEASPFQLASHKHWPLEAQVP